MRKAHFLFSALAALCLMAFLACQPEDESPRVVDLDQTIGVDTTLSAGTRYRVSAQTTFEGQVIIEAGCVFEMAEGARLIFQQNVDIQGRSSSPVKFKGEEGAPFDRIRCLGDSVWVNHAEFINGSIGMLSEGSFTQVSNTLFDHCELGLWINNSHANGSGNRFISCYTGIKAEGCEHYWTACYATGSQLALDLTHNTGSFTHSILEENYVGVMGFDLDSTIVENCNVIHNNFGFDYFYGYPLIYSNNIMNNTMGIRLRVYQRWFVEIERNNIVQNSDYGIYIMPQNFHNPHSLSIPDNWWGTTNPQAVAELIYDGTDQMPADTLVFLPVASQAWPIQP